VIAAGGTGGHIFPGIAIAREIRARRPAAPILFVGTRHGLESRLVGDAGFPLELVSASGFAGKRPAAKLAALGELPAGFFQARRLLQNRRARAVAGVGGYVTVPVVAAARSLQVPTLIHESNAFPGVANRLLNRFATRTAVGVAAANAHLARPGVVTGTPVRPEFFGVPPVDPSASTRRLLVFGGSQGSRVLNRAMVAAAPVLSGDSIEVVHQAALAFTRAKGTLADHVMAAMEAADANGGDHRCNCGNNAAPNFPCDNKTAHVAYILMAEKTDTNGDSHNNGTYAMFLRVAQPDKGNNAIREGENLNPVKTLRLRYDEWRKKQPASFK